MSFDLRYDDAMGKEVLDKLSGLKGVIVAVAEYYNGCVQYLVKTQTVKDGKHVEGEWIDREFLEILGQKLSRDNITPSGGPSSSDTLPPSI